MTFAIRGIVTGHVQGVGFRNHVKQQVARTDIEGHALNLPDGTVEVLLIGPRDQILEVQKAIAEGPRHSRVDNVAWEVVEEPTPGTFRVG